MTKTKKKKKSIRAHIVFEMFKESFAINVKSLLNILEMQKITKIPEAPPYMKGVINLRGEVLPVVDSHVKFGNPPMKITSETCILVLDIVLKEGEKTKLGLMVDAVEEVREIKQDAKLPPPGIGESYQSKYITGMVQKSDEDFIMILDIDKLLSENEIIELKKTKGKSVAKEKEKELPKKEKNNNIKDKKELSENKDTTKT
ncbi:MAG: chemotaxis protein CheW [Bacteroidota bacterium]|nr:chemotaxis protein CheW [Bacteroidota bacterium]